MIDQIFSWGTLLSLIGVVGFELAGRKIWWCWYVNIANQLIWLTYALVTEQYGFLVGVVFYSYVFIKNAYLWTTEHFDVTNEPIVAHNIKFDREMMMRDLELVRTNAPIKVADIYRVTENEINLKHMIKRQSDADFERGVRQAMTWLKANYPESDMPEWRSDGVDWIANELAYWKQEHPDG